MVDGHLNKLFEQFEKIATPIPFTPAGNLLNADLVEKQTYSGIYFIGVNTTPIQ